MADDNMAPRRLVSLDALRGFTMFLLIGGGEIGNAGILSSLFAISDQPWAKALYAQTAYSYWGETFHVKDLVMPLFIFVVGAAMPYSFAKRLGSGDSKRQLFVHVIQRTVILFVLGMIAGGHLLSFDLSQFYVCNNVLQQIAIGYFVTALFILNFNVRGQLAALVVLLLGYWALMTLVPVPGYGVSVLKPDANLARYVDDIVLGNFRPVAWNWTWAMTLPLSTSCTVMLGALAGQLLKSAKSPMAKFGWLSGAALGCLALSLVWRHWFPIIAEIWTGSWVLFVGGLSLGLLSLFYLVIDVWGLRKWAFFFVVIGSNCIALYMAAHLFDFRHIGNVFVGGLAQWVGPWNDFVQALAAFIVIWLILFWMYRTKSFIKV
jgi:predicted acyltransferase